MKNSTASSNRKFLQTRSTDRTIKKGLILISDISGFTSFVQSTDILQGKRIISELLLNIIEDDLINLNVSEIEGDAIFFYKSEPIPSINNIVRQYEHWLKRFNQNLKKYNAQFERPLDLSLKVIAHYGEIVEYNIHGHHKLYGEVVIESHRLLKNSINSHSYILITDELMNASLGIGEIGFPGGLKSSKLCEIYGDLRNICFTYFDYSRLH